VPFHQGRPALERVVSAISASTHVLEIIVVANGDDEDEDLTAVSRIPRVRVVALPEACGPAIARNRGAALSEAPILVFIDADVIPHPAAIANMLGALAGAPDVAAVFGAYDHEPEHRNFFSQYRNLAHAFVHERARAEARTFWAGLGAIRRSAFALIGGFDERFALPSIEDIDLGYRLAAGHRLRVDTSIRGTHLKRWTLFSSIVIDIRHRGVPWTQAILKYGAMANDLNVSREGRAAVALAYVTLGAAGMAYCHRFAGAAAAAALAGFVATQWNLLRWFARMRGRRFALGVLAAQFIHHLCNGVSFAIGSSLWTAQRLLGWRTRWTLPPDPWGPRRGVEIGSPSPQNPPAERR
jgi:GT2 family glycosyltransferase